MTETFTTSGLGFMMTAYIPRDDILNMRKPSSVILKTLYSHCQLD